MNIIITGVSKGLGYKIAVDVIKRGWVVFGISRTKNDNLDKLVKNYPKNFNWFECDLNNPNSLRKTFYEDFLKNHSIDGFVNNAALAYDDLITNLNPKKLQHMYQVNVFSPMLLTKLVIRNMILHRKRGKIVHISSISAHTGYKGLAMYASTKGALEAFSKNCAREWGSMGINSNCVVAGFMETSMSSSLSDNQKNRIYKKDLQEKAGRYALSIRKCMLSALK